VCFIEVIVVQHSDARLLEFLEAVYAVERPDEEWLLGALGALSSVCGEDHKYLAFCYDASNAENLKVWSACRLADNPEPAMYWVWGKFLEIANETFVRATFRSLLFGCARQGAFEYVAPLLEVREQLGQGDFLYLNALDPSGKGCLLTVGFRQQEYVPDAKAGALFKRMASHLSAAYRIRRRLSSEGTATPSLDRCGGRAEAILDGSGRLLHAEGPARAQSSRDKIRNAALAIDSARSATNRSRGFSALDGWHPLMAARWTLVEQFESDGRRYIVACENQVEAPGFHTLTDRERQIVVHAAFGMTNKEIAYTLGVSHTTVRVLMARAARRLGVERREALLAHPSIRELRPEGEGAPISAG
jgi:DNA-binding CsgD family transcriptional regulator